MGVSIKSGSSSNLMGVDSTYSAARTSNRPLEAGTGGHYSIAARSGTMAVALGANTIIFGFRWPSTTHTMWVHKLKVHFQPLTVFTANTEISFEAYFARSFTANLTGGTGATTSGNNMKTRTDYPTSQFSSGVGDIRWPTTAALAGSSFTLDAQPFDLTVGAPNIVNAAAGTAYAFTKNPFLLHDRADLEGPLLFEQNEGVIVRNAVAWGAAGTAVLGFELAWSEIENGKL